MECPICLNIISDKYLTDCNHEYCKDCLDKWFDRGKNDCPKCRHIIKYLNNKNINIRLISINKPLVIERNIPRHSIMIKKTTLYILFLGYVISTISIGYNIYFINNYE